MQDSSSVNKPNDMASTRSNETANNISNKPNDTAFTGSNETENNISNNKLDANIFEELDFLDEEDEKEIDEFLKRSEATRANWVYNDIIIISDDDEVPVLDISDDEVTLLENALENGAPQNGALKNKVVHPAVSTSVCLKRKRVDAVNLPSPFTLIDESTDDEEH